MAAFREIPKIPRHEHPAVEDDFFDSPLHVLEKVDGQNFRVLVYDERFEDVYSDEIPGEMKSHRKVIFGTKTNIQGTLDTSVGKIDGSFRRVFEHLRENINVDAILEYHEKYDSPLVLFGEHMLPHTLDYGYDENPPPAFVGFEVFPEATPYEIPAKPFDDTFSGFLSLDEVQEIFDAAGLESVNVFERGANISIDEFTVPMSTYGMLQAEGVVFRDDRNNRRAKYVTEEFKERQHSAWGAREDEVDTGEEVIVARYMTNGRVRKHMRSVGEDNIERLAAVVTSDVWVEEWPEIRNLEREVCPSRVFILAEERCEAVVSSLQKKAKLNNTTIDNVWADEDEGAGEASVLTLTEAKRREIEHLIREYKSTEAGLARVLVPEEKIHTTAEKIAAKNDREIGRWVISHVIDGIKEDFWADNLAIIANLSTCFTPTDVMEEVTAYVSATLNQRDDIEEPTTSQNEPDFSGFSMFE